MGIFDSMLVKYGAVMVGYAVVGLPVFGPRKATYLASVGNDKSQITKDYVRNSSLLINLAKAIGRLVVLYKEIQSLAGYTSLIYELKEVLDDLEAGKYKRGMVTNEETKKKIDEEEKIEEDEGDASPDPLKRNKLLHDSDNVLFLEASMKNKGQIV